MANSAFTPAVLTVSGSSSTSSGEKNYVTATDGNASGLWVASGVTVATSTSTIPDNITKASSLAVTWTSGTTGYARYRFTLDQADYGKKFKIQWDQVYGTAGHWTLQVYSNTASDYTGTSTALTVQTSAVPGITGTFTTSVDMPGSTAPYIEIRIVASSTSATTIYLNSILMGPGTIVQGAAISEWQNFATNPTLEATTTNPTLGSTGSTSAKYRRVGSVIEVDVSFVFGGTGINFGSGSYRIALPSGFTIDYNALSTIGGNEYAFGKTIGYIATNSGASRITITGEFISTAGSKVYLIKANSSALSNTDFATGGIISLQFSAPLSEWSGSGTVSLGAGAQVEYAADDGTADVFGPNGALVPNVGFGTGSTQRVFSFQYPQQATQSLTIELNNNGNGWAAAGDFFPFVAGNNSNASNFYGIRGYWSSSTQFTVEFGNQGTRVNASNADNGASSWATNFSSGMRFRVAKANPSSPVGFGLVTGTDSGLMKATSSLGLMRYNTSNGYGSTNTAIRRFSTLVSNTSSVTYADTAANGTSFTITESGIYAITYGDSFSGTAWFGLSLNSSQLTTNIANITAANRLVVANASAANLFTTVSWVGYLASGDILRPHSDATTSGASTTQSTFTIQRLA